jgi:hypothetical protein
MVAGRHPGWGPKPMVAVDIFRIAAPLRTRALSLKGPIYLAEIVDV